jgi:hypothetical protein
MITENELRIGNLVLSPQGVGYSPKGIIKVESIFGDGINHWQDMGAGGRASFTDIQPIPLTPEILEKCGFEFVEDSFGDQDLSRWQYTFENYGKSIDIYLTDGSCNLSDRENQQLNYVHQLQNLFFAISGRELEVKLPLETPT